MLGSRTRRDPRSPPTAPSSSSALPAGSCRSFRAAILDPVDLGAECAEALVDALVAAFDLADVVDGALPVRAESGKEHGHAGADVGRFDVAGTQPRRSGDE